MATGAGLVKKNALGYNIKMSKSLYAKEIDEGWTIGTETIRMNIQV